jgi:hypothetical protein
MAWTAEDRVILASLKLLFKEKDQPLAEIEALTRSGIDEDALLRRLEDEGVAGLVYFLLSREPQANGLLAHQTLSRLRAGYQTTLGQNLQMLHHLATVLEHLERARIKTIVWKGAALLEEVYPSLGTREMGDVDLVVLEEELERVRPMLAGLGLSSPAGFPHLFFAPGLSLDIHTDIVNSEGSITARSYAVKMDIKELWQRGVPWREGYAFIRVLSPCDAVLTLSAHLQRHSFSRLIWFLDIALFIRHCEQQSLWGEWEWAELLHRAQVLNLTKCLHFTLHFLRDVLEFPVPGEVLQSSRVPRLNIFERVIFRMMMDGRRFDPLGELLFFCSVPGIADRCRFLRDVFSPRPETIPPGLNTRWLPGVGHLFRLGRIVKLTTTSIARAARGRSRE